MIRLSYKEGSEERSVFNSIRSLYNTLEELDRSPEHADITVEDFSGIYRSGETVELECVEQLYEVAEKDGKLLEAEAEFAFDDGEKSELRFSYFQKGTVQRAQIESNSPQLVELAEEAIEMDPTLPSRGISYLKGIVDQ